MPRYSPKRELPRLQAAVAALQPGPQRRYPTALRRKLTTYIRAQLAAGGRQTAICEELGIGSPTFKTLHREGNGKTPRIRRVRVVESRTPSPTITVRGPGGLVIEDLDIDAVARLLRALA